MYFSPTTKVLVVVAALFISSLTTTGLIAACCATSRRHWFVRTAIYLAAVSPLLLIPAYEAIVAFVLQSLTITLGVALFRRRRHATSRVEYALIDRRTALRFSLSTLLLQMVLVAICIPIAVRLPPLNVQAWVSIAAIGVVTGVAVLFALWVVVAKRRVIALLVGVILSVTFGALLNYADSFVYAIVRGDDWPPIPTPPSPPFAQRPTVYIWAFAVPLITALSLVLICWAAALRSPFSSSRDSQTKSQPAMYSARAIAGRLAFLCCFLALAAFPIYVLWQLIHPLPLPVQTLPEPNGYNDIATAGAFIDTKSPILSTMVEPSSTAQLAAEVAKFKPEYDQIRLGLSRPISAWIEPDLALFNTTSLANIQAMRGAARALHLDAELAMQQHQFDRAAEIAVESMRVGVGTGHGGIVTDWLVGVAIEGIGQASLFPVIQHLGEEACRRTIAGLNVIEQSRDSVDAVLVRDGAYEENAYGWSGHLFVLVQRIVSGNDYRSRPVIEWTWRRYHAISSLLKVELAICAYQQEHASLPDSLESLVPSLLPQVPIDPFDPDGGSLRYKRTDTGYLLYSVGFDLHDNGGTPPPHEDRTQWNESVAADLRLDDYFAPDEPSNTADDPNSELETDTKNATPSE